MRGKVDLHTHTTASDGQYTPAQLVGKAAALGLSLLAVTDHDTVDGLGEALQAGRDLGLSVLRGVELGAREERHLHLLGYGFDPAAAPLTALCQKLKEGRDQRKFRIVDFLREKGVPVSLDEVEQLAGGDIITRPHFAQVMVRRGYVASTREAFQRYLDTDEYQRIERFKADARTCIEAIKDSGGVVSLAHPCQMGFSDDRLEALIRQLKGDGLDALECFYPTHSPAQTALYCALAEGYGLHVTGGSDFHGERVKPDIALGGVELDAGWLLALL